MPGRPLCVWHACAMTPGKELGTMENLMGWKEIACTSPRSIAVFIVPYSLPFISGLDMSSALFTHQPPTSRHEPTTISRLDPILIPANIALYQKSKDANLYGDPGKQGRRYGVGAPSPPLGRLPHCLGPDFVESL